MRRLWVISVFVLACLVLSGCGSRIELNDLGILAATGVDGVKGDWTITYQVIIPSAISAGSSVSPGGGSSQAAVHTFSTHGTTIREAIDTSNLENPRKLYFAHNNVLIIGKKAAEAGIEEVLDTYFRSTDARETVNVLIADGEARNLLKMLVPPEKIPGQALKKILKMDNSLGAYYPSISVYELTLKTISDSGAVGVPEVSLAGSDGTSPKSIDIFKQTSPRLKLKLSGLSVFHHARRVASLNRRESLGISWLTNHVKSSTLSFKDENSDSGDTALSTFRVDKTKVTVTPVKGPLHFTLNVKAKVAGELIGSTSGEDISKSRSVAHMQKQVEKIVEAQIMQGWTAVQRLDIDLVGIADKVHRKYPHYWKQNKDIWPEELSRMEINLDVKAVIRRPGLFQKSLSKLLMTETE
ncbi:Ger(x)C family spore germination protein [Paenibacillus sp. sgz500958]|uniref:Ger(x)C family spore germination protein n=1 Tax=Paenibacillus sp. sgz500958 TaxID=3242475 RepID=UPI0036D3FFC5